MPVIVRARDVSEALHKLTGAWKTNNKDTPSTCSLSTKDNLLFLRARGNHCNSLASVGCNGDIPDICVSGPVLQKFLDSENRTSEVKLSVADNKLILKTPTSTLKTISWVEDTTNQMLVPDLEKYSVQVPQALLDQAFKYTSWAAKKFIAGQTAGEGFLLSKSGSTFKVVATNGSRLAVTSMQTTVEGDFQVIVMPEMVMAATAAQLDTVRLFKNDVGLLVMSGFDQEPRPHATLISVLADSKFPDYEAVMQIPETHSWKVDRHELQLITEKILNCSGFGSDIDITCKEGKMRICTVEGTWNTDGSSVEAEIAVTGNAESGIRVRSDDLATALAASTGQSVMLRVSQADDMQIISIVDVRNWTCAFTGTT